MKDQIARSKLASLETRLSRLEDHIDYIDKVRSSDYPNITIEHLDNKLQALAEALGYTIELDPRFSHLHCYKARPLCKECKK